MNKNQIQDNEKNFIEGAYQERVSRLRAEIISLATKHCCLDQPRNWLYYVYQPTEADGQDPLESEIYRDRPIYDFKEVALEIEYDEELVIPKIRIITNERYAFLGDTVWLVDGEKGARTKSIQWLIQDNIFLPSGEAWQNIGMTNREDDPEYKLTNSPLFTVIDGTLAMSKNRRSLPEVSTLLINAAHTKSGEDETLYPFGNLRSDFERFDGLYAMQNAVSKIAGRIPESTSSPDD